MLTVSVCSSRHRQRKRPARPRRRRTRRLRQGGDHPSPQTQAPHFARRERKRQCKFQGAKCNPVQRLVVLDRLALAFSPSAVRRVLRLMQHSCGSARRQRSCVGASPPHHLRRRSSKVEFNLAAIPPHLYREESRQKCSGHPGSGPSARWRRLCQSSFQGSKTFALAAPPR
jgi:hypothetical protein